MRFAPPDYLGISECLRGLAETKERALLPKATIHYGKWITFIIIDKYGYLVPPPQSDKV
jgi:hypothetical protein